MSVYGWLQIGLFVAVLVLLAKPLGGYMARVYEGQSCGLDRVIGWFERLVYRVCRIDSTEEMTWVAYARAMVIFNLLGILVVFALQRVQQLLPLNPEQMTAVSPELALNTAVSFATNTNWQSYGGETTLSYLTQMLGLTVQNFLSAAAGMAVLVALVRGFVRRSTETIGNFWCDLVRSTLYVLLPLSVLVALVLVSQGVVQTLRPYEKVALTEPVKDANGKLLTEQTIAVGPAASQIAIKQLGTNGGGFFNANSAHPFENPTPLANFVELLSLIAISGALCYAFGKMAGDTRQGWALLAAMLVLFLPLLILGYCMEQSGNPALARLGVDQTPSLLQPGGNMEGKEVRHGIAPSAIWAAATTATSCGAVNSMHDSYTPLGGLVPLWLMHEGEVVFGGVGSGLYGMLAFAVIAVFIAGLMVGRTPEYLGKKIEAFEMKMAALIVLIMPMAVLIATAAAVATDAGKAGISNPGPHGFSQVLYAFTSAGNNNGSAFGGLDASKSPAFYNLSLAIVMLIARYWLAIPALAMAGSLARKKHTPVSAGTLPTHTPLFVVFLAGTVILVSVLTFIPALALGPIVEHLMMK